MVNFTTSAQSISSGRNNGVFGPEIGTLEMGNSNSRNQFAANSSADGDGGSYGGAVMLTLRRA